MIAIPPDLIRLHARLATDWSAAFLDPPILEGRELASDVRRKTRISPAGRRWLADFARYEAWISSLKIRFDYRAPERSATRWDLDFAIARYFEPDLDPALEPRGD